jgi:hypothetical protein
MQPLTRSLLCASFAGGLLFAGAGAAGAATSHTAMTVTKTGKIAKFTSASAFTITVSGKTYVVKTNDMTHVKVDSKASKVSALKKGETVTVKGEIEMETITATSVVEQM